MDSQLRSFSFFSDNVVDDEQNGKKRGKRAVAHDLLRLDLNFSWVLRADKAFGLVYKDLNTL